MVAVTTWFLSLSSATAQVVSAPKSLHRGFEYADIASKLIGKPSDRTREACREACLSNGTRARHGSFAHRLAVDVTDVTSLGVQVHGEGRMAR